MAIVVRKKISIPLSVAGEEVAKVFVQFPSKEDIISEPAYEELDAEDVSDSVRMSRYLKYIAKYMVGWEGIEVGDEGGDSEPLEFNEENVKVVAPLVLEDKGAFNRFLEAMGGITEKK
jgi:hypothetical protein